MLYNVSMEYITNKNIVYSCKYHAVWCPKYRRKVLIDDVERRSSRILRQEFKSLTTRLPTLWTNSYFVSTVGGSPLSVIKRYIESQKHV